MNSNIRIAATQFFRRDMVCLRSVIADTLHEGDTDDDDGDDANMITKTKLENQRSKLTALVLTPT